GLVPSLVDLSLARAHRRSWGSLSGAFAVGTMDQPVLRASLGRWPLYDGQPISGFDTRVWPRMTPRPARHAAILVPRRGSRPAHRSFGSAQDHRPVLQVACSGELHPR